MENTLPTVVKKLNLDYQHMKLIEYFIANRVYSYNIFEAKPDYYENTLQKRQYMLGAPDIRILCKTIVLENTAFDKKFGSEFYRKYYLAIVQYTNEFNGEKLAKGLKALQNTCCEEKLSKKYFHLRLADCDVAYEMTGYRFNCITPYLMKCEE
jgi:hypothetical protein